MPAANRHVFEIAQAVLQVGDAVLARQLGAELDHLLGIVDGDHPLGALRHQLRDGAFARAQVGDDHGAASASAALRRFLSRSGRERTGGRTCPPARRSSGASCPGGGAGPGEAPRGPARLRAPRRRPRAAIPSGRRALSGGRKRSCPCGGRPPGRPVSVAPGGWKSGSAPLPRISCSSATDSSSCSSSSSRRRRFGIGGQAQRFQD